MKNILFIVFLLSSFHCYGQVKNEAPNDPASNLERITNFYSDINILTDGKVIVTEHITVYANNIDIKRGIVRQIPLERIDSRIKKHRIEEFTLLSVKRNGIEESYSESEEGKTKMIHIGNKDILLPIGYHEYTISYESYGHISSHDGQDILLLHVTGNGWTFPIDKASATITLPEACNIIHSSCFTDRDTAEDKNCNSKEIGSNITRFETDRILSSSDGLTIAVSFRSGLIKNITPTTEARQNHSAKTSTIALLLLLAFYYFTWLKFGKTPKSPSFATSPNPPNGWCPATMRFLTNLEYDNQIFTTAIMSLSVKKALRIVEQNGHFALESLGVNDTLSQVERSFYSTLFGTTISITTSGIPEMLSNNFSSSRVEISGIHEGALRNANNRLYTDLSQNNRIEDYLKRNLFLKIVSLCLAFFPILVYAVNNSPEPEITFFALCISTAIFMTLLLVGIFNKNLESIARAVILCIGGGAMLIIIFIVLVNADEPLKVLMLAIISYVTAAIYCWKIKSQTKLHIETLAEIDAFKTYINQFERLYRKNEIDYSAGNFERILPYTVALNISDCWTNRFSSSLAQQNYNAKWYLGDNLLFSEPNAISQLTYRLTISCSRFINTSNNDNTSMTSEEPYRRRNRRYSSRHRNSSNNYSSNSRSSSTGPSNSAGNSGNSNRNNSGGGSGW